MLKALTKSILIGAVFVVSAKLDSVFAVDPATINLRADIEQCKGMLLKIESHKIDGVDGDYPLGSGFFINNNGYIVTCFHVIFRELANPPCFHEAITARNYGFVNRSDSLGPTGQEIVFHPKIVAFDSTKDIAILYVNPSVLKGVKVTPSKRFQRFSTLFEGDDIMVVAFGEDSKYFPMPKALVSRGVISTLRKNEYMKIKNRWNNWIQSDVQNWGGASGALIYSITSGRVIGMHVYGHGDSGININHQCSIAISADDIEAVAKKNKIPMDFGE